MGFNELLTKSKLDHIRDTLSKIFVFPVSTCPSTQMTGDLRLSVDRLASARTRLFWKTWNILSQLTENLLDPQDLKTIPFPSFTQFVPLRTSFYNNYQNPPACCFLRQIRAIVFNLSEIGKFNAEESRNKMNSGSWSQIVTHQKGLTELSAFSPIIEPWSESFKIVVDVFL